MDVIVLEPLIFRYSMNGIFYLFAIISLSALPVLLAALWFRRHRRDFYPRSFVIALCAGVLSLVLAALTQYYLPLFEAPKLQSLIAKVFLRIALTEELSRVFALLALFSFFKGPAGTMKPIQVGASEGLVAGFAFAMLETASYAVSNPHIALIRILSAVPLHGACGARVGMALGSFKTKPTRAILRFLSAVAIHGIYDLFIVVPALPFIFPVLIALVSLGSVVYRISRIQAPGALNP